VENADRIAEPYPGHGKTLVDAMATEVVPAAMAADYYRKKARRFMKDTCILPETLCSSTEKHRCQGSLWCYRIISPWNYPFSIPFSEVVMALLAGNTVLLKVARETPMVGELLKECFEAAGFPENVFNYVSAPGSITGDAFIDAGVNKIFFTGSVETGKYLMKQASKKLIPLVLELGGNDPMIVCEDADIERAAEGAVWAGLQNAGQSCGGVERIYVHESVYKSFLTLLKGWSLCG
jgi:succinate-semialdehyde dehydrogenase/glutarate-semialdehyde dehydrogenase